MQKLCMTLAATTLMLAGCSERQDPMGPAFSAAAVLPNAVYTMTLEAADFPGFFPPEVVAMLSGTWELDLTDPHGYTTRLNGNPVVTGTYTKNAARLVKRDVSGVLACLDAPQEAQAVYGWNRQNDVLTLSVIQDHCGGRAFVLTARPWQKQ
jgi:uncharacterized lipoprotein NlpE involved in copper resistance